MPLSILTSLNSLRIQRRLAESTTELNRTFERLSSGQRINRAADDAAGLAVSVALKRDSRLAMVALRNANDGLSMISVANGALNEIMSVLERMTELAEQSANGVYSNQQRSPMQQEFALLASEIERIATTTKFNGLNLLAGPTNVVLQVGIRAASSSQISLSGVQGTLQALHIAARGTSNLSISVNAETEEAAQQAARIALDTLGLARQEVAEQRGVLGAAESRLGTSIRNLLSAREQFEQSASRVTDVDVAQEAANATRLQILQSVGQAVLAQANQSPQIALTLLQ